MVSVCITLPTHESKKKNPRTEIHELSCEVDRHTNVMRMTAKGRFKTIRKGVTGNGAMLSIVEVNKPRNMHIRRLSLKTNS